MWKNTWWFDAGNIKGHRNVIWLRLFWTIFLAARNMKFCVSFSSIFVMISSWKRWCLPWVHGIYCFQHHSCNMAVLLMIMLLMSMIFKKGLARTQIPTNRNYAIEFPTFGEIAGVNPTGVQWKGLALEEPPSWSWLTS